jgi:uracil-DNA glycosylase
MDKFIGDRNFPLWLIGDSPPKAWKDTLDHPFDSRHPTRHSIWTPIENVLQRKVFDTQRLRLRTEDMYIINGLESAADKPNNIKQWDEIDDRIEYLRSVVEESRPRLILTFGRFSFELFRRVLREDDNKPETYWTFKNIGDQFRLRIDNWDPHRPNVLPLLHASIARRSFIQGHQKFCPEGIERPNYFEYVGEILADKLLSDFINADIWVR